MLPRHVMPARFLSDPSPIEGEASLEVYIAETNDLGHEMYGAHRRQHPPIDHIVAGQDSARGS